MQNFSRRIAFGAVASAVFAIVAQAQTPAVQVQQPWARATTASARAGGAFMILRSTTGDAVTGASSPAAETVELHQTVNENGVMKMLPVPALMLEPGKAVELKPGSYHIMLIGLKAPLKRGESFPMTLTFRNSPPQTVQVQVQAAGAAGPGHAGH